MTLISPSIVGLVRNRGTRLLSAKRKSRIACVLALSLLLAGDGADAHRIFGAKPPESNEATEKDRPQQTTSEDWPRTDGHGDPLPSGAVARLGCLRLRHGGPVYSAVYSPDGKLLASCGSDGLIRLWNARTGKEIRRIQGHVHGVYRITFSYDGKLLASCGNDGIGFNSARVWDVGTGKKLHQFAHAGPKSGYQNALSVAFSPEGKILASGGTGGSIYLWDISTEKVLHYLHSPDGADRIAFSPDGATLFSACQSAERIRRWEVATEKELPPLSGHKKGVGSLALDAPGRSLVSCGRDGFGRIWDLASGKERLCIRGGSNGIHAMTFSPDGRNLATSGGKDGSVYLWETATGKMRRRWDGHIGFVRTAAFSSEGKLLVTGGDDGTALVWDVMDVAASRHGRQAMPSADVLADCWTALSSEDAEKAWLAARTLVLGSEKALSLLREHLSAPPVASETVERWITQLDDDSFAVRQRASRELAAKGKPVLPALRRAQARSSAAESARRLKELIARLDRPGLSPAELADLRAIEVLEHLGSAEACQLLARLAKETADARRTQEAKASLRRLEKRPDKR